MHVGLCLSFHPLSMSASRFSPSFTFLGFSSPCTFHLFPPLSFLFPKEVRRLKALAVGFGIFAVVGIMSHFRAGPKVWLWRAVTWPVAHLSTLLGLAWEARSSRATGRLELNMALSGYLADSCAVSAVWSDHSRCF